LSLRVDQGRDRIGENPPFRGGSHKRESFQVAEIVD
jgi:hypothetical protein